ncbi:MAG: diguanylate cyclase domain-containing protein [Steroidobacterales bacterium]
MAEIDAQLLRNLVDGSPQAVALVDVQSPDQPVVYANRSFETLTGYTAEELLGRNLRILQGQNREQDGRHRLREALGRGEPCHAILRNYRKDGTAFWNDFSVIPLRDAQGNVSHFAAFYRDSRTERDAPASAQAPQAPAGMLRDDRLTGLYSWLYLEELLKRDWAVAQREQHSVSIFSIDIDALELYNTTFGRAAGDSTIRRVAHCIAGCLRRASDAAARIDGGSFVAFATGLTDAQALHLGRVVAERVRDLRIHHPRCTVLRFVSVSIGVANAIPDNSATYDSLVQQAHRRLQTAKQSGRNTIC